MTNLKSKGKQNKLLVTRTDSTIHSDIERRIATQNDLGFSSILFYTIFQINSNKIRSSSKSKSKKKNKKRNDPNISAPDKI